MPRELLAGLFARIHGWLRPGGLFLASLGASDLPGWTGDFLGAPTYFSGFPPEENTRLLAQAGYTLLRDEVVAISEPEGDTTFHWVLAQAGAAASTSTTTASCCRRRRPAAIAGRSSTASRRPAT